MKLLSVVSLFTGLSLISGEVEAGLLIGMGDSHTCISNLDGSTRCWGRNNEGQLGLGDRGSRGSTEREKPAHLPYVPMNTGEVAISLSGGINYSCAAFEDGSARCWGKNEFGKLGLGLPSSSLTQYVGDEAAEVLEPIPNIDLGTGLSASQISGNFYHTCVLLTNGRVKCWGNNSYGQLGIGSYTNKGTSSSDMGDSLDYVNLGTYSGRAVRATQITTGGDHSCALLETGAVKCWGRNNSGQAGQSGTSTCENPSFSGSSYCFGDNSADMGDSLTAVDLGSGRTATAVYAGLEHTCALLDNSTVKCWGASTFGQLGQGNASSSSSPIAVNLGQTAKKLTVGGLHSCVVLADDTVKCWGNGDGGKLGYGDTSHYGDTAGETPTNKTYVHLGSGTVSSVHAGYNHTCAIFSDNAVKCWGYNYSGQLGLGDTSDRGDAGGDGTTGTELTTEMDGNLDPLSIILSEPEGDSVVALEPVTLTTAFKGPSTITYQWQRYYLGLWSDISSATSASYTRTTSASDDQINFRCKITSDGSTFYTQNAKLTVTVESADQIPVPTLTISPTSSSGSYNGQKVIRIQLSGGVPGFRARIFVDGTTDTEVGSFLMTDEDGEVPLDVTTLGTARRDITIYAYLQKNLTSSISIDGNTASAHYYYDPAFTLSPPSLTETTTANFTWSHVTNATSYKVWRRIGDEVCTPSDTVDCLHGTLPYTYIGSVTDTGAGTYSYDDSADYASNTTADGISYYVTAVTASTESVRSNLVSWGDTTAPEFVSGAADYHQPSTTPTDGRSLAGDICTQDLPLSYQNDNAPNLTATVKYKVKTSGMNCATTSYASGVTTTTGSVDLFMLTNYTWDASETCVSLPTISSLLPETDYCVETCLSDPDGNSMSSCTTDSVTTAEDNQSPTFTGVSDATARDDGITIRYSWTLADEDITDAETVSYRVEITETMNSDGTPNFDTLLDVENVNAGTAQYDHTGNTATKYCARVFAEDSEGNRSSTGSVYECETTLDNRPALYDVAVRADPNSPFNLVISFYIRDRQADWVDHKVGLTRISYQINGGSWVEIDSRFLSNYNPADLIVTGEPRGRAGPNSIYFDTLSAFGGEQNNLKFKIELYDTVPSQQGIGGDSLSNTGEYVDDDSRSVFEGMSNLGKFGNEKLAGCSIGSESTNSGSSPFWILLLAASLVLLLRRSIRHERARTERK